MTATPRRWAVLVDNVNPRIVMIAQQKADGLHWTDLVLDEERSTAHVTVLLGADGEPAVVEAEGAADIRALEAKIGEVVYLSEPQIAGSPTLDCLEVGRWMWWHGGLLVSRDAPPGLSNAVDPFTEALAQVQENEERRARRLR